MKKFLALILTLAMALSLAACGGNDGAYFSTKDRCQSIRVYYICTVPKK